MKRPVIISFGEVLWDLFPEGARFGGAPANFACHAAILGGEVSMVSAVGDDTRGREAIEILRRYGIDVDRMQIIRDAPTGTVEVKLDSDLKPSFTIHEASAWDRMAWSAELESRIANADAVYFGTLGQRSEVSRATIRRAIEAARAAGIPRILDINLRPPFFDTALLRESIAQASILKLSDEELADTCVACGIHSKAPPETLLRQLLETQELELVVMTRGTEGAMLASADTILNQPGIPTTVRDTVGAGDSFAAALLIGLLQGDPHEQNLRNACVIAAAVCSHPGAVPNLLANDSTTETKP